mgnify:CR=1 FL=1
MKLAISGEINSKEIGKLASYLGAGRNKKEDVIDPSVGIVLNKKVGDKVNTRRYARFYSCKLSRKMPRSKRTFK